MIRYLIDYLVIGLVVSSGWWLWQISEGDLYYADKAKRYKDTGQRFLMGILIWPLYVLLTLLIVIFVSAEFVLEHCNKLSYYCGLCIHYFAGENLKENENDSSQV